MIETLRRALALLDPEDRRKVALVGLVSSAGSVVQALVLLSLMPFIVLLTNPEMFDTNPLVMRIASMLHVETYSTFVVVLGAATAGALTLGNLFVAAEHMFTFRFIERLTHRTTARVLRNVLSEPWERIGGRHAAALGDVVVGQVARVTEEVVGSAIGLVSQLVLLAFIVSLLLVLNPGTTAVALGGLVAAYIVMYAVTRRSFLAGGEELTQVGAEIATTVKEALDGAREIRIRRAEGFFSRRFERAHQRSLNLATHYEFQRAMPHYLLESVVFAGFVAVSLYFLLRTADSGVALSWLALYAFSVYRLVPALVAIFDCAADIQHNSDAIQAVEPYCRPPAATPEVASNLRPPQQHIRLAGVSYRHSGREEDQIEALDLVIPAGRSLCLFGPSGAGKSTLLNLIAGLVQPQQGQMFNDETPVDQDTADAWREHIGYVPQPVYLFADSLASNIAFGEEPEQIDGERIARVAALANLTPVISRLPQGALSPVGEHGATLSGGERQRVGIARALYRDPAVLLFDESFANLDAQNRHAILDRLFAMRGKTLVFSSHERDVVERCDRIVVVERGRIVAQGSYQELLSGSPRFVELLSRLEAAESS